MKANQSYFSRYDRKMIVWNECDNILLINDLKAQLAYISILIMASDTQ